MAAVTGEFRRVPGLRLAGAVTHICERTAWLMRRAENLAVTLALLAMALFPFIEILGRALFNAGVPGSIDYVRHLTLWVSFIGAAVAARETRHLALGFNSFMHARWRQAADMVSAAIAGAACLWLSWASFDFVRQNAASVATLGGVMPEWVAQTIMPIGFGLMGLRFLRRTGAGHRGALCAGVVTLSSLGLALWPIAARDTLLWPGIALIGLAGVAGAPIFVLLGGAALLLFFADAVPLASVPLEAYRIASHPILPTIPLFTLAGAILAEGKASERLARLFRALFGWMPGGTAVASIAVCAFFTTFTGGSGVAILALGGLMLPVLLRHGYGERFSMGALTASGSLGILLPPSLLVILYGVSAQVPIDKMFVAGIGPGLLLVAMYAAYTIRRSWSTEVGACAFDGREALAALWQARWEVLLPVAVLSGIFSGRATLVEVAALAALYVMVTEFVIHRHLRPLRDLPRILVEASIMIGGIMIILAAAMGLTNYLVYSEVPARAADWVQTVVTSPWLFLLALNAFLLVVGCLLDIFSALVVIVPLILPLARAFGIDPLHLGVVFLANMQLGYLTPPVGMNLFLAAFRFKRPVLEISAAAVPFFVLGLIAVLIITFVPALSVGVIRLLDW